MNLLPISNRADLLIVNCEVTSQAVYQRLYARPTWPGGASGLTWGVGYDGGYETPAQVAADWVALGPEVVRRLQVACGMRGGPVDRVVASFADIVVPWDLAIEVHRSTVMPRYIAMTAAAFPNCAALSPDCFGALVSLVYNRGPGMADEPGDSAHRRLEMRAILADMTAARFNNVPVQLRAMKRLWRGLPGMAGLVQRREDEAALFEEGLGAVGVVRMAPPPAPVAAAVEVTAADLNDSEFQKIQGA